MMLSLLLWPLHWIFSQSVWTFSRGEIGEQLPELSQGKCHAVEYALEFCTLTSSSGWNKPVPLKGIFQRGLTELACHDDSVSLNSLIDPAICLDDLLWKRPALCLNASCSRVHSPSCKFIISYIDDIRMYSPSLEEHVNHFNTTSLFILASSGKLPPCQSIEVWISCNPSLAHWIYH